MSKRKKNNKNRGVALLISLFSIMMLSFIAVEVSYDTSIDYIISSKEYHKLRAYYTAKAGVDLSLLRIVAYENAHNFLNSQGNQLGPAKAQSPSLLDRIWTMPFSWPFTMPTELSNVDRQSIEAISSESLLEDVEYETKIETEGSKIDLTTFAYNDQGLQQATKLQLINLFKNHLDSLEEESPLEDIDYELVVGNIQDWADTDDVTSNNRTESSLYEQENLPPNRAFRTLEELRMVSGVTNDVFNFLLPHITVYGAVGINPNNASDEILKSLHPNITDQVVERIRDHLSQTGPFSNANQFLNFLARFNVDASQINNKALYFSSQNRESSFLIKSVGQSGSIAKEIKVVVYDRESINKRLNPSSNKGSPVAPLKPPGRPVIIYWYEN